jgi:hypothetical protein
MDGHTLGMRKGVGFAGNNILISLTASQTVEIRQHTGTNWMTNENYSTYSEEIGYAEIQRFQTNTLH